MIKFLYIVYGVVVVIVSTITNLAYIGDSSKESSRAPRNSGWFSNSGSSGSSGGFSSGGGHK